MAVHKAKTFNFRRENVVILKKDTYKIKNVRHYSIVKRTNFRKNRYLHKITYAHMIYTAPVRYVFYVPERDIMHLSDSP